MEIGILGLTFNSGNKGCEALSYSFLEILEDILEERNENIIVNIILPLPIKKIISSKFDINKVRSSYYPQIQYKHINLNCIFYICRLNHYFILSNLHRCSKIYDFTAGDSFTDIYGDERFWSRSRLKKFIIDSHIPLILGSQTIGPFNSKSIVDAAVEIINKAQEVYVRDKKSYDYVKNISGRTAKLTSDIAFALPYHKKKLSDNGKPKIGFNASGLLWSGGYTQDNQFHLTVDYREYCRELIKSLLPIYEIHLIPHAFTTNPGSKDNDYIAVNELHEEFPETIVCKELYNPMDIKSYISQMDVFLGARMHATIAAFSAGVPVVPFSYSRKFEGLFDGLHYNYVIHGKESNTNEAIEATLNYIENREQLKKNMQEGLQIVKNSNEYIKNEIERNLFTPDKINVD